MGTEPSSQRSCIHCGDCARACPEALNPEALFFALVGDDFAATQAMQLDACTECSRCVEVCPSHIPLLDWFRWGKSELREHERADAARKRFLARNGRLASEREARAAKRREASSPVVLLTQTISRNEVLAAIARGKAKRRGSHP